MRVDVTVRDTPGGGDVVEVRALHPDEWQRLRSIRLEALAVSPLSYTTTLEEAQAYPDTVWMDRAAGRASDVEQRTMVGIDGPKTVAMGVGLLRSHRRRRIVPIVSVFVSAPYRRLGVGRAVMRGLEAWASERGADRTSLWVVEGNDGATRFYESLGYRQTLDRQKIRVGPVRWEVRLERKLNG